MASKIYTFKIEGTEFSILWWQVEQLLNEYGQKLVKKVSRQGGELNLTLECIKPGLIN